MKNSLALKKKIIYVLFTTSLLLLITLLAFNKIFIEPVSDNSSVIDYEDLNERFLSSVKSFGLDDEWIKEKKSDKYDHYYLVLLPPDLPIPVVLSDIYSSFKEDSLKITSAEKIKGGKTELTISQNQNYLLKADFRYNKKISRERGMVGFFVSDFTADDITAANLLKYPEPFCIAVLPSKKSAAAVKAITKGRKEYAVLLNDEIEDLDYRMREGYSEARLKNVVRLILSKFSSAIFFTVDDKSDFFNTAAFNIVKNELQKRNIKLYLLSTFGKIEYTDEEGIRLNFGREIKELKADEKKIFYLNNEELLSLLPEIKRFRKIGVKFLNVSELIDKQVK